ncbi:hypothetical protein L2E82_38854 [Cichorium intybus]|uniref:Uncharacterized protein n=1 Tax=Cichorium intybus TaxID=13427 RepID=A0ACB9AH82_CICIN|nr:hypothetical protein L2E82_38854 [Cichorium intybus]
MFCYKNQLKLDSPMNIKMKPRDPLTCIELSSLTTLYFSWHHMRQSRNPTIFSSLTSHTARRKQLFAF